MKAIGLRYQIFLAIRNNSLPALEFVEGIASNSIPSKMHEHLTT